MKRSRRLKTVSLPVKQAVTSAPALDGRVLIVDGIRGTAVILMLIYHFCYDLQYLRLAHFDFYTSPFWLNFRFFIVSLFVFTAGSSLALATANGIQWRAVGRRLVILVACALVISAVTYGLFQQRFVFFGILHFIALASVLGLGFIRLQRLFVIGIGLFLIILGTQVQHTFFNQAAWQWVGLMTYKPATEDYVPLLPWFGVFLIGLGGVGWLQRLPTWNLRLLMVRNLCVLGRYSLSIYLLHQPILLGILWGVKVLV